MRPVLITNDKVFLRLDIEFLQSFFKIKTFIILQVRNKAEQLNLILNFGVKCFEIMVGIIAAKYQNSLFIL